MDKAWSLRTHFSQDQAVCGSHHRRTALVAYTHTACIRGIRSARKEALRIRPIAVSTFVGHLRASRGGWTYRFKHFFFLVNKVVLLQTYMVHTATSPRLCIGHCTVTDTHACLRIQPGCQHVSIVIYSFHSYLLCYHGLIKSTRTLHGTTPRPAVTTAYAGGSGCSPIVPHSIR